MKTLILTVMVLAQAQSAWAYGELKQYDDKVRVRSLLFLEHYHSLKAPPPEDTVWGKLQDTLHRLRSARQVVERLDEEVRTGSSKDAKTLARARQRLTHLERSYREVLWLGMSALAESLRQTRNLSGEATLLFKKRQVQLELKLNPEAARLKDKAFDEPVGNYDPIAIIKHEREQAFAIAVQAETILKKARARLGKDSATVTSQAGSVDWFLDMAEASMSEVSENAQGVASRLGALLADSFPPAISATEHFVAQAARGELDPEQRNAAARALNEARDKFAELEHQVASDVRVARHLTKLMDTEQGAL